MKAVALYSGGKDSVYALHLAHLQGYEIVALLTVIPYHSDSMIYHKPDLTLLQLQSKALEIPLIHGFSSSHSEDVFVLYKLLKRVKEELNVDTVVSGVIASYSQKTLFDKVTYELGLKHYHPLWLIDQEKYLYEVVENGLSFIIFSISTYGLDERFLCKPLSINDIAEIIRRSRRFGFNPSFEGGEAETLVLDAPLFKARIVIEDYEISGKLDNYVCIVKKTSIALK